MNLLVLAHAGTDRDLLEAALESSDGQEFEFVDDWETFMSQLVTSRPPVVILAHSTLNQAGDAGMKAADMTLRALNVATVIALSETNKDQRFPLEMETEFEHFVIEPYGPADVRRAICTAMGVSTGEWPIVGDGDARPASEATRDGAPAQASKPTPAEPVAAPQTETRTVGGEVPAPERTTAPQEVATSESPPQEDSVAPPVESAPRPTHRADAPTPLATVEAAEGAAAFFAPALDSAELSRVTADYETVSKDEDFDNPAVSAVLNAFFDGNQAPEAGDAGDAPSAEEAPSAPAENETGSAPEAPEETKATPPADAAIAPPADAERTDDVAAAAQDTAHAEPAEGGDGAPDEVATASDDEEDTAGDTKRTPPIDSASVSGIPLGARSGSISEDRREVITVARSGSISIERRVPEPKRSESTSASDVRVSLALPDPNTGDLAAVHLPRVLYALSISRATGELVVRTASLERRFVFLDGEPGSVSQVPTAADENNFLSAFQWTSGTYEFKATEVPKAQFYTFGEPLELIARGIERHFGLNETATALGNYLKEYPVVTDQLSRFARVLGMEGFNETAGSLDGKRTLEELMMTAGAETESVLRRIFFAWLTGVAIFEAEPCDGPAKVTFDVPQVASGGVRPTQLSTERRASVWGVRSGSYNAVAEDVSGAYTVVGDAEAEAEQKEMFERLQEKWKAVSSVGGYEAFELRPGCGEDEVNRKFYELVRQFHPDRFARSHNAQIRALAEKLFVHIRRVHSELMAAELGDGPAPAAQPVGGRSHAARSAPSPASAPADAAAGVARRRQRARELAMSGASVRSKLAASSTQNRRFTRTRRELGESGESSPTVGDSRGGRQATMSNMRRMKPDQLFRNARAATEQGNFTKALDLLELAVARGQTGDFVDAYHEFLRYTQEEVDADDAIERLNEIIGTLEDGDPEDFSMVLTLVGHTYRLEELPDDARKYYKRASRAWSSNESASRWLRHLNKRAGDGDKKGPFSSAFLNKLFTTGKSK